MKIAPVLAAILAGAGLSSASRCKPSASPSVSSASSSSISAPPSSSPSSSPPTAPTCGPEAGLMVADTDLAASPQWYIHLEPSQYSVAIDTCNGGPPNDCIRFVPTNAVPGIVITFTYTANALVVGDWYTWEFQLSEDADNFLTYDGMVFTPGFAQSKTFQFTQMANTWQPVSFSFQATDPSMALGIYRTVPGDVQVSIANFNLYKTCPDING